MIRHVVMWRFQDKAAGRTKEENLAKVEKELRQLPMKIKEIRNLQVGTNVLMKEDNWDLVLMVDLEDVDDLEIYQAHPAHKKVCETVGQVRESRAAVDFLL